MISVILSTLILRGGWVGAANTKKNITSAGTATPITLRLRLHSMAAHAASVRQFKNKNKTMREVNNKELNPKETLRILWRGFIISVASVLAALAKRNK